MAVNELSSISRGSGMVRAQQRDAAFEAIAGEDEGETE